MPRLDPHHFHVAAGDTLSSIGRATGVPVALLKQVNRFLPDPNVILVGDVLHVPPYVAPPKPPTLVLGFAAYTEADRARWTTANPQYSRLAGSWAGRLSRGTEATCLVPVSIPAPKSVGSNALIESSVWTLSQAMLWDADGNGARLTAATAKIDQFVAMARTLPADDEFRLVLGWALSNYVKAMWIVGYDRTKAADFLRWCIPHMYWWGGGNWLQLFAAVRVMIAGWLKDEPGLVDAQAFLLYVTRRNIWHPEVDGDSVVALAGYSNRSQPATMYPGVLADLAPDFRATADHWDDNIGGASQLSSTSAKVPASMLPFANCEDLRDLPHVQFTLASLVDALACLRANGVTANAEVVARFEGFAARHAQRVFDEMTTGSVKSWPTPASDGGDGDRYGWYPLKRYLGSRSPSVVDQLLALPAVRDAPAGGFNHMAAEAFATG